MEFLIFDESYYLANNPDVAAAVNNGIISSGLEHFEEFGLQEGRANISALFNEQVYLANNSDVAVAVAAGFIESGLQHFLEFGQQEGRANTSALFNEQFYLTSNPDVAAAIAGGFITSGLQHFLTFGQQEGRTNISPFFNEQIYLTNNPDVAAAVAGGFITSGLEHFLTFGLLEGRNNISSEYSESIYLFNNPDVAAAVSNGVFASGLEHLLLFGAIENRLGVPEVIPEFATSPSTFFNEDFYLIGNPDVGLFVALEFFDSSLDHYEQVGQFDEERTGFFSGTSGNDIVTGFGTHTNIIGVDIGEDLLATSLGIGEVDILIGGDGEDVFLLGYRKEPLNLNSSLEQLYVGNGNNDFALIQNFERFEDGLFLAGSSDDYSFNIVNGNLNISTDSGDLIAIVEGTINPLFLPDERPGGFFVI